MIRFPNDQNTLHLIGTSKYFAIIPSIFHPHLLNLVMLSVHNLRLFYTLVKERIKITVQLIIIILIFSLLIVYNYKNTYGH